MGVRRRASENLRARSWRRRIMLVASTSVVLVLTASAGGMPPSKHVKPVMPRNMVPPSIAGTAQVGHALKANPGRWSPPKPMRYAYHWRRCSGKGLSCSRIVGATGRRYTLVAADIGATLRVAVTARDAAGARTAVSARTHLVRPAPRATAPANSSLPTITGTAVQGQVLSAAPGAWAGTPPLSYGYQWRRCDASGGVCTDVAGATAQTYTLVAADVGATMRVAVTATNAASSGSATSVQTRVVQGQPATTTTPGGGNTGSSGSSGSPAPPVVQAPVAPSNTSLPTIAGPAVDGQQLSAAPGTWSGTTPIGYAYQWLRCGSNYQASVRADGPVGYWRFGESSGTSAADLSGNVNTGTYAGGYALGQGGALTGDADKAVRFQGPTANGTVTVPNSASLNSGDTVGYEVWIRLFSLPSSVGAGGNIATKNTGTLLLRVLPSGAVTMRQSGGNAIASSTQNLSVDGRYHYVVASKDGSSVHLYIDGVDVTGPVTNQTLTNNTSQLAIGHNPASSNDGLDADLDEVAIYNTGLTPIQVQQHYAAGTDAVCTPIAGATGQTYQLTTTDVGTAVRVAVTATNSAGSRSATSAASLVVVAAGSHGFQDQSFATAGDTTTSGSKPESKLWWNDGFWWASMWSGNGFHIFRLDRQSETWVDTGTPLDPRAGTRADALWDPATNHLYVASHVFAVCGCSTSSVGQPSRLYRFAYNSVTKTYSLDAGFPVTLNDTQSETLVIDKDSTGTLWATWVQDDQVMVRHSSGDDATWSQPFVAPVPGATGLNTDDISSLLAFGGNKIGVMWSNQVTSTMYFAVHVDGQPDSAWDASNSVIQGSDEVDDHINLKSIQSDGSGRVFVVFKTSLNDPPQPDPNAPILLLGVRDPTTGQWTTYPVDRVGDDLSRPILLIDETHRMIHVFSTGPQGGGAIYEKTSPLDSISFPIGLGTPVIEDAASPHMGNATSTKQNVNSTTGIVVLASDDSTNYYWHMDESLTP